MLDKSAIEKELEEFSNDDELFYDYLLSRKKDLTLLNQNEINNQNKIHGCMSVVHITIKNTENKSILKGFSDSSIICGVLGIFQLAIKNDPNPKIENYKKIINIINNALSQNRRLGLENMLKVIFNQ